MAALGCGVGWLMRAPGVVVVSLALAAANPARAQFSLEPDWARRPGQTELSSHYPKLPLLLEIEGRVTLACDVTATGSLASCVVHDEKPAGFGFGDAARQMAATFQMRPGISVSRLTPHGAVRIPINFTLPKLPAEQPAIALSPTARALAARLAAATDTGNGDGVRYYETEARRLETQDAPADGAAMRVEAAAVLRAAAAGLAPRARAVAMEAIAARLEESELASIVRFAESPAGRRWFGDDPSIRDRMEKAFNARRLGFRHDAREGFCKNRDCTLRADAGLAQVMRRPPPGEPAATDPDAPLTFAPWQQRPDARETLRAWPISYMLGVDGYARAVCTVGVLGGPEECEVAFESPKDLGVGAALLSLMDHYRVTPEFLKSGVGKKVSLYAVFPSGLGNAPQPDPALSAPAAARFDLAKRIVAAQAADQPPLDEDPDFVRSIEALATLEPGLRGAATDALRQASLDGREAWSETRARFFAEAYDEANLREIALFEEGLGHTLRRALKDARPDLQALGQTWNRDVAAKARAAFCRARDCTAPPPLVQAAAPDK